MGLPPNRLLPAFLQVPIKGKGKIQNFFAVVFQADQPKRKTGGRDRGVLYTGYPATFRFEPNFLEGEWIVIEPPRGPKGMYSVGSVVSAPRIYCANQKAADAGKLDKIVDLFEWMSYGKGYMLCGFGREGIEDRMNDGNPVSLEGPNGFNGAVG